MQAWFSNKVAVVTGAVSSLGRAIAIMLSQQGARVLLFDRDAIRLAETAAQSERALTQQAKGAVVMLTRSLARTEAAATVFFLLSAARFITGVALSVDGGRLA